MLFVKTEDLKKGMRLAKPIYNKKGVLLYERNTKLTQQGISSIRNFEIIGIYILEPAEPVPPMSEEDIEFERFQTVAVFNIKEDLQTIMNRKKPKGLFKMAERIISTYGRENKKMNFTQNIRSTEDYIYKHALNVAILAVMIARVLKETPSDMQDISMAAIVHDLGLLMINERLACSEELSDDEYNMVKKAIVDGYDLLEYSSLPPSVIRLTAQVQREMYELGSNVYEGRDKKRSLETKILMVADKYDRLTAMKVNEEPTSEYVAIKQLLNDNTLDQKVVRALMQAINILTPGVCVELTNGEKGLVITENERNILKPMILGFDTNKIYDMEYNEEGVQLVDIMKTMDNRTVIDKELLKEYM